MRYLFILVLSQILNTKSSAQELFVFSDLALFTQKDLERMDCDSILSSAGHELRSPALEPGETLTMLVVVKYLPGRAFVLQTGQYPPDALSLSAYRLFPSTDAALELVAVPAKFTGRIGESQRCAIFLIDAKVPLEMTRGRLKLEPAIWAPAASAQIEWIRYPMEVRILEKTTRPVVLDPECEAKSSSLLGILYRNLSREGMHCKDYKEGHLDTAGIARQRRMRGKNQ
jgi:hypothetical protein